MKSIGEITAHTNRKESRFLLFTTIKNSKEKVTSFTLTLALHCSFYLPANSIWRREWRLLKKKVLVKEIYQLSQLKLRIKKQPKAPQVSRKKNRLQQDFSDILKYFS